MAAIRLATLPAGDDVAALLSRLDALERKLSGDGSPPSGTGGVGGGARPSRNRNETEPPREKQQRRSMPASASPEGSRAPRGEAERSRSLSDTRATPGDQPAASGAGEGERSEILDEPRATSKAGSPPPPPPADAPLDVVFDQLRRFAQQTNRGLFAALEGGRLVARSGECLRIAVPEQFAARRLEARSPDLEAVCTRFFGGPLRVEIECDVPEPQQAGRRDADSDLARRRRQEALDHPAVNDALEILGGEIVEIRPLPGGKRQ
jgi:DNA polymerase-3 subunit gamma/tau